jgi:hypothetical protein
MNIISDINHSKVFINWTKWIDELDVKVDVEVDSLHAKRIIVDDLVGYVYIVRVNVYIYQYYKGWVARDLCVSQNYCLPNNPRCQSTWPIEDFRWGPPAGALQAQHYMIYELNFGI